MARKNIVDQPFFFEYSVNKGGSKMASLWLDQESTVDRTQGRNCVSHIYAASVSYKGSHQPSATPRRSGGLWRKKKKKLPHHRQQATSDWKMHSALVRATSAAHLSDCQQTKRKFTSFFPGSHTPWNSIARCITVNVLWGTRINSNVLKERVSIELWFLRTAL